MNFTRSSIIDLFLFVITLSCAWFFQWKASDLVWSLWVSSLTIGYISLIFGPLIHGIQKFPWKNFKKDISSPDFRNQLKQEMRYPSSVKGIVPLVAIISIAAIFFLGFFTIHFGMFHYIHGIFLNSFFPLEELTYPKSAFSLPGFAIHLTGQHWEFVLASAISQFFRIDSKSDKQVKASDFTVGPYKSVIRMHLMIFVFAFLNAIKVDNFIFYAITLLVYFLPWEIFKKKKASTVSTTSSIST